MAESTEIISSCLNLMRRLPPKDIENSLEGLVNLVPQVSDELLQRVDQPLQEATDPETGRRYLRCEYNRDASSYRSPWSNKYDPPIEDGFTPGDRIRQMEANANMLLDAYREVYYTGGVSSVYLWEEEEEEEAGGGGGGGSGASGSFAGCFLILKRVGSDGGEGPVGAWESSHVVQVMLSKSNPTQATYKVNTTVMLSVEPADEAAGVTSLSGNLAREKEETKSFSTDSDHLENLGVMIEAMENTLRSDVDGLYVQKTRQIVNNVRSTRGASAVGLQSPFSVQLKGAIGQHGENRRSGGLMDALNARLGVP
ncbi:unnamed protein product [Pylaiella littoralis]